MIPNNATPAKNSLMADKMALNVQNALDGYKSSKDLVPGIDLISYARQGYIVAKDPDDTSLLDEIASWQKPSAPVYVFLRKAQKGLFSVNVETIGYAFS